MTRKTWEQLVDEGRRLVAEEGDIKFRLGDLALEVEPIGDSGVNTGAHERLGRYAEEIGVALSTLRTYRQVAKAWPGDWRYSPAPWTVHLIFAPRDDRRELIRSRDGWTYREAAKVAGHKRTYTEREVDTETGELTTVTTTDKVEAVRRHLADPEVRDAIAATPEVRGQVLRDLDEEHESRVRKGEHKSETVRDENVHSVSLIVRLRAAHRAMADVVELAQDIRGIAADELREAVRYEIDWIRGACDVVETGLDGGSLDEQLRDLLEAEAGR